jgi:hypothetical protein
VPRWNSAPRRGHGTCEPNRVARVLLRRPIGPLELSPEPKPNFLVEFEATTKPEGMLSGLVQEMASPTGLEPVFLP